MQKQSHLDFRRRMLSLACVSLLWLGLASCIENNGVQVKIDPSKAVPINSLIPIYVPGKIASGAINENNFSVGACQENATPQATNPANPSAENETQETQEADESTAQENQAPLKVFFDSQTVNLQGADGKAKQGTWVFMAAQGLKPDSDYCLVVKTLFDHENKEIQGANVPFQTEKFPFYFAKASDIALKSSINAYSNSGDGIVINSEQQLLVSSNEAINPEMLEAGLKICSDTALETFDSKSACQQYQPIEGQSLSLVFPIPTQPTEPIALTYDVFSISLKGLQPDKKHHLAMMASEEGESPKRVLIKDGNITFSVSSSGEKALLQEVYKEATDSETDEHLRFLKI